MCSWLLRLSEKEVCLVSRALRKQLPLNSNSSTMKLNTETSANSTSTNQSPTQSALSNLVLLPAPQYPAIPQ